MNNGRLPLTETVKDYQAAVAAESQIIRLVKSTEVIKAQESERRRIASELHDGLGQRLTALKYSVEKMVSSGYVSDRDVELFTDIIGKVRDSIEEVRRISMQLCPSLLEDFGLMVTIDWLCREVESNHTIRIDKDICLEDDDIKDTYKIVIFRIIQEAFANIVKHAGAQSIRVVLKRENDEFLLQVRDDGCGIGEPHATKQPSGFGLRSMRRRVEMSNGIYSFWAQPGRGTHIQASWHCSIIGSVHAAELASIAS